MQRARPQHRRLATRWLVFVLAFMLFPGAPEAFVDVGHALVAGDSPHADEIPPHSEDERHTHGTSDEHGCSGLFHVCRCCPAAVALPQERAEVTAVELLAPAPRATWSVTDALRDGHAEPPFRPPAA